MLYSIERIVFNLAIVLVFGISGFQCENSDAIKLAAISNVTIDPNPVLTENGKGKFEVELIFPPNKIIPKLDSIEYQFYVNENAKRVLLGRTTVMGRRNIYKKEIFNHTDSIQFQLKASTDSIHLFMESYMYSNGKHVQFQPFLVGWIKNVSQPKN